MTMTTPSGSKPQALRSVKSPLILIADDSLMVREMVREGLEEAGFRVAEARDGVEAVALFAAERPDLVLLDIHMPKMDGFAACREIRRQDSSDPVPVIMLTSLDDEAAIRQAYETGATDFICKPFKTLILNQRIRYLLRASGTTNLLRQTQHKNLKLSRAVEASPVMVMITDTEGKIEYVNPHFTEVTGLASAEVVGTQAAELGDQPPDEQQKMWRTLREGGVWQGEFCNRKRSGETYAEFASISSITSDTGEITHFVKVAEDISKRKAHEVALRKLSNAVESSPAIVMIVNVAGIIEYVNPKYTRVTGYSAAEVIGKPIADHGPEEKFPEIWKTLQSGKEWRGEIFKRRKNGELFWQLASISPLRDSQNQITHYVKVSEDVTERKWDKETIHRLAYYDTLTSLPNRLLFEDRLKQAIARNLRNHEALALISIDLYRFGKINDSLGHAQGDRALQILAERLRASLRESDTLARYEGDMFNVLLPNISKEEGVAKVVETLIAAIGQTLQLADQEVHLSASAGIALFPTDGETPESLRAHAEAALRRAQEQGAGAYQFFVPSLRDRAVAKLSLENDLRRALENNLFTLHYQPQFNVRSGELIGAEALLRWQRPSGGFTSPAEFIPLAEETGLIHPLGEWVLRRACSQAMAWKEAGLPPLRIAVNISGKQLQQPGLPQQIAAILQETGMSANSLELEITESAIMEEVEKAIKVLRKLKAMGITLAVDDFGTGYSSLSYLKRFPIDILKIDRSFVMEIAENAENEAIINAVIALAKALRLKTLAEGVETREQQAFLLSRSCDLVQGFFFAAPMAADEFFEFAMKGTLSGYFPLAAPGF